VLDRVRLLRPETVAEALRPQAVGPDEVLEDDVSWGLGLQTYPDEGFFGLGGIGGFAGFGLRRRGLALGYGYVTCRLSALDRSHACEEALEEALAA
jgi:hypothetical protein